MDTSPLTTRTAGATATKALPARWTAERLTDYLVVTPALDRRTETEADYEARFVRGVEEFGLSIRHDPVTWPENAWRPELMPVEDALVERILSSTQTNGVCLDIVGHYLRTPDDVFDPDGWFGNEIPVLIRRADGTYTIRDGNHRCLAAKLRGDIYITAHVVH